MKKTLTILSAIAILCSCGTTRVSPGNADDEIVDLGYSKESKRNYTGASSRLDAEKEINPGYSNMYEYLQGRVAGVVINGDPSSGKCSITIRGNKSILMDSEPLILLDGQEISDLMVVSPDTVSSVEVLKDAGSTAIYGSRGANGVILIRTKSPR